MKNKIYTFFVFANNLVEELAEGGSVAVADDVSDR